MFPRLLLAIFILTGTARVAGNPGIILITVDGIGWGDFSASGSAAVPTPHMDKLLAGSAVFRDFHVSPLDAVSRAALLTGLEPAHAGVWGNHSGRHRLRAGLLTIASHLRGHGYVTALAGTWALGDNCPSRPCDHGYTHVLTHPGGTPGGVADFYSNDGTDDLWILNGEITPRHGSCVEVTFGTITGFIGKNAGKPFFCHLSPGLPRGMPEEKIERYRNIPGIPDPLRAAWIADLDAATGDLLDTLDRLQLSAGTIVVLTSTTGMHSAGRNKPAGFNAGRRGSRGGPYEGGHCVPLAIRWPGGGITAGNVSAAAAHFDLFPTIAALTGTALPADYTSDGISLAPFILSGTIPDSTERILITEAQEIPVPSAWRQQCVMAGPWRLINGRELYDLRTDPGQRKNLAGEQSETVQRLRTAGESWWNRLAPDKLEPVRTIVGGVQDPVLLTPHDWLARGSSPVTRDDVIRGTPANGQWLLEVAGEGNYDILLRRWPLTVNRALNDSFFTPDKARLRLGTADETKSVPPGSTGVNFRVALKPGPAALQTWLTGDGKTSGAYFVEVRRAVEVRAAKPVPQPQ